MFCLFFRRKRTSKGIVIPAGASLMDDHFWDCSVCTFRNNAEAFKCSMCDVRKGTSTRKPRLNPDIVAAQQAQVGPSFSGFWSILSDWRSSWKNLITFLASSHTPASFHHSNTSLIYLVWRWRRPWVRRRWWSWVYFVSVTQVQQKVKGSKGDKKKRTYKAVIFKYVS